VSWHGIGHFVAGGIGFTCLIAACFVVARRFAADGRRDWAVGSRTVGALFLAGFAGVASGTGSNLAFVAAVIMVWGWISALAVHEYRRAGK
jgi:hypothetical protein